MSITLDYTDLQVDDEEEVMTADELWFQHEMLLAEVVFRIDAADFSVPGHTTLLEAASILHGRVKLLGDGESSSYDNPLAWDKITFTRAGDQVTVSASFTDATATVGFADLLEAVAGFHHRVTRDMVARYPRIAQNPGAAVYLESPDG